MKWMESQNDIKLIENKIEEIFNRYTNADFEHLVLAAFVYKRTIRFVPIELRDEVQGLIDIYEKLIERNNVRVLKNK